MPRYKLTIAYEGTDFCGWQKQSPHEETVSDAPTLSPADADPSAEPITCPDDRPRVELRTVQGVVERAVREVVREPIILMGASRTDSGVHARAQVAAFTCSDGDTRGIGWPLSRGTDPLLRAVNSRLPHDVLVTAVEVAAHDFNPIQGATSKAYSYTIHNSRTRPLFDRRTALHLWDPLDARAMDEAARIFEGEHDFAAFAAAGHGRLSTIRTIFACRVREEPLSPPEPDARRIVMDITGSGFLWNMVRIIGGTLVQVGRQKMSIDDVKEALRAGKREMAGPTLPPTGLCLEWIKYEDSQ